MLDVSKAISAGDAAGVGRDLLRLDWRRAAFAGAIAAAFTALSTVGLGRIGDAQALNLLEAILPTTRFMASAILGSSATIIALMLTVLSLSQSIESGFERSQFQRINQIAVLCTVMLTASMLLLLVLNVPLRESEALNTYYTAVYYFIVIYSSALGGLLISTVLMLYAAIRSIIGLLTPEDAPEASDAAASDGDRNASSAATRDAETA